MTKKLEVYKCNRCGNVVAMLNNGGAPLICCHEEMKTLNPNTTDAAQEKHVPAVVREGATVKVAVGSVAHPMTDEHAIQWIAVAQGEGVQIKWLSPSDQPVAEFTVAAGQDIVVYEYCNLHGLWSANA